MYARSNEPRSRHGKSVHHLEPVHAPGSRRNAPDRSCSGRRPRSASREARCLRRGDSGIEIDAAESHQTEGLSHCLHVARRFPETRSTDRSSDSRRSCKAGSTGSSMSSWPPKFATVRAPMLIGRMQLQQMSVIGFGNLPGAGGDAGGRATPRAIESDAEKRVAKDRRLFIRSPVHRCEGACLPGTRAQEPAGCRAAW